MVEKQIMKSEKEFRLSGWILEDLFKDEDAYKKAQISLNVLVDEFETARKELNEQISEEQFLEIVKKLEQIQNLVYQVYGFAELRFSANTQDQENQAQLANVNQFIADIDNRTLFFSLWWKNLDDRNANRLIKNSGDYRYWLEEMRHFKPHTLSEPEEKIINTKNITGVKAFNMLYDSITTHYVFHLVVDGEEKRLTRGELMVYVRSNNPVLREAAYKELYRVYGDEAPILGQIYQTIVRDWRNENVKLRKYPSPISARNLMNDIPDDVVNTLLDVCRENAPIFQKYFKLKARLLGVEKLRRYDIYAPVAEAERKIDFDKAVKIVLDSFEEFSPRFSGLATRVFSEGHLDSEIRAGKSDGAFCATITPDLTPWVLVNYQSRINDVTTLAHELGHAIHAMLAEKHSVFTQQASLPLAETASTFGEMMLVDKLLSEEKDEIVRRDLLFRQVDDNYATIMRQAYFAIFESTAHEMITSGATVEALGEAYWQNLLEQFGDSVHVSEEFKWEWVSIPHFYRVPFYVYAYAFGQLLVLSLYKQYKEEGESFKPKYIKILSAGGSESPKRILLSAGIDIYSHAFWQGGFDVIGEMVNNLVNLV